MRPNVILAFLATRTLLTLRIILDNFNPRLRGAPVRFLGAYFLNLQGDFSLVCSLNSRARFAITPRHRWTIPLARLLHAGVALTPRAHSAADIQILLRAREALSSRYGCCAGNVGESAARVTGLFASLVELLGEGGAFAEDGAFPVDDVDGNHEDEGDAEEDGVGVGEVVGCTDVCGGC